jgi:SAM-dependent methyltransferase
MSSILGTFTKIFRVVVPLSIRKSILVAKIKVFMYERLDHETIYDSDYYKHTVEVGAVRSAEFIATSILLDIKPNSVVDVGCGTGVLLDFLRQRGCHVLGLEYSEAALQYCRDRKLDVRKFDLEKDAFMDSQFFDVAISMEVAEHLPKAVADRYVDLLARLSNVIVFTAAPPGQGGTDHVNEQPPSYWISKFQIRGFVYDEGMSKRWRESWEETKIVDSWYYENLMIFRRTQTT